MHRLSPSLFFSLVSLFISILLKSRAFTIGSLLSIGFLIYLKQPRERKRKAGIVLVIIMFFFVCSLIFLFKVDSSSGRMLIYKISFKMFEENWLTGIGFGNFKNEYLLYQAEYFHNGNYTKNELLMADNTYFAFNDYWQWIIEMGVFFVVVLLVISFQVFNWLLSSFSGLNKNRELFLIGVNILIILCASAFFTHVFEKYYFQILLLLAVCLLSLNNIHRYLMFISCCFITSIILINKYGASLIKHQEYMEFNDSKDLYLFGYRKRAFFVLESLKNELYDDPKYLISYAEACVYNGDNKKAILIYKDLLKIHKSNLTYLSLGHCYNNLNDPISEEFYLKAIDMVPNRFITRKALFDYYLSKKKYKKALLVGNEILELPIKINSSIINSIKLNVKYQIKNNYSYF